MMVNFPRNKQAVMKLEIKLRRSGLKVNLKKELSITRDNIDIQMMQQPAKFAWYATLYAYAKGKYATQERYLKVLRAKLYRKYKKEGIKGYAKITDGLIYATIDTNKKYQASEKELLDTKLQVDLLKAAVDAFIQRKELMQSIGSNLREERKQLTYKS